MLRLEVTLAQVINQHCVLLSFVQGKKLSARQTRQLQLDK